jgi:hypothetical protein
LRLRPVALGECLGCWPETVGRWALSAGELRVTDEDFRATSDALDARLASEVEERGAKGG